MFIFGYEFVSGLSKRPWVLMNIYALLFESRFSMGQERASLGWCCCHSFRIPIYKFFNFVVNSI
jgi:hypothetical protein